MGGFLAIFAHIYLYAGRGDWFAPQRLAPALGNALIFAHLFALLVWLAHQQRLAWPLRIIFCLFLGILAWWAHLFFYLYQSSPDFLSLVFGGIGLALAFIPASLIKPLSLQSGRRLVNTGKFILICLFSALCIYAPIYWSYQNFLATFMLASRQPAQALLYFQADNPEYLVLIGLPFALCLAFFANLPLISLGNSPVLTDN